MRTAHTLHRSLVLAVLGLCVLVPGALPAGAGELKGVTLPDTVEVGGQTLQLNGMALRKAYLVAKVYVAGLYLPERATDAEAVLAADTPRRMVMHWVRNVGQDDICEGWMEGLEKNTDNPSAELKKQFETLCEWTGSAKDNDEFVFTYVPGEGTHVEIAGEDEGTMEGKSFADALFASWIGPDPGPGQGFKKALMGG